MINRIACSTIALLTIVLSVPAHAQFRDDNRWRGNSTVLQGAYDRGYRDGAREGERDARAGRYFEYDHDRQFQNADAGYRRDSGDRESYRRAFRQGYSTGYTRAYNSIRSARGGYSNPRTLPPSGRFPAPGYGGGYGSPALDLAQANGYRDGLEKGNEDWRKHRSADVLRHSWYRSGDRGFDDDRRITKDRYRDAYREGFRAGYDRAYRAAF